MSQKIEKLIKESVDAYQKMLSPEIIKVIAEISRVIIKACRMGKKIIIFGNGGSAADAQHFAAELICRFEKDGKALPAVAITTNTSSLTAISNDFDFQDIFKRQVEALAKKGDVVVGISTSGNSKNVLSALKAARKLKAKTVGLSGNSKNKMKNLCDLFLPAPSSKTARIQECHILAIHLICSLVEDSLR